MSNYRKYLFVILFLILGTTTANANVIWPSLYISAGQRSAWAIVGGLIVEIGFVKYFTKCSWLKTVLVSIAMNIASATLGNIALIFGGLGLEFILLPVSPATFLLSHWFLSYFLGIIINTLIEGGIIRLILKLKFKDTYKWLALANAISIIIGIIYVAVADIKL